MDLLDPKNLRFLEIVEGDLFDHDTVVVTVKTQGRWYGRVSRDALERFPGLKIPHLVFRSCKAVPHAGKAFIFACQWDDANEYTAELIYTLTKGAIHVAARAGAPEVAFPLLGGNKRHELKPAMGAGIRDATDELDDDEESGEPRFEAPRVFAVVPPPVDK